MQMHTRVRIGRGSRWCFGAERIRLFVCLFVYHHLSSAVTPPVPPPRFRAPLAATVLTPTAHHSCARSLLIYMCWPGPQARRDLRPCTEFSMNSHGRVCLRIEKMRPPVGLYGFFPPSLSLSADASQCSGEH